MSQFRPKPLRLIIARLGQQGARDLGCLHARGEEAGHWGRSSRAKQTYQISLIRWRCSSRGWGLLVGLMYGVYFIYLRTSCT